MSSDFGGDRSGGHYMYNRPQQQQQQHRKRSFVQKQWTYEDTTNAVNKGQYIEAHLEGMGQARAGFGGPSFTDERPMRLTSVGAGAARRGAGGASSVQSNARPDHWRSWDIAANAELAKATLRATSSPKGDADSGTVGDAAGGGGAGLLPPHLHRSTLKMQLPLQHRIVTEMHDRMREGVLQAMASDGRKLALRLVNSYVRPVCADGPQQARLLAYYLYDLREALTTAQRLVLFGQLTETFEHASPDHLAILLAGGGAPLSAADRGRIMGALRDEIAFAGHVPYSLGAAFAAATPTEGAHLASAIALLRAAPDAKMYADGAWSALARSAAAASGGADALQRVQSVIDAATEVDERHMRNIGLWNAYISASDAAHAAEMLMVNMPRYGAVPDMLTFSEVSRKCAPGGHWEVALEVAQRAVRIAPSAGDASRFHGAYRETLASSLATLKAKGRLDDIDKLKRLVPDLKTILQQRRR